ncbi:ATP-binding cassette domain-containing protein [Micromonospora sp. M12]
MDALSVRGLSRNFGNLVVLDDVSFTLPAGRIAVVLGPNGSGKTTLLRCVVGADRPDAGEVLVQGRRADETDPRCGRWWRPPWTTSTSSPTCPWSSTWSWSRTPTG